MSDPQSVIRDMKAKMRKSVDIVQKELLTIRTNTASTALVDSIPVEHYGTVMPLNQLAHISVADGRMIVIQPWDMSAMSSIEKAIQKSQSGLVPNNDGKLIRVMIPHLSEERLQELVKVIKKITEDGKIAIRNERRDGVESLRKLHKEKSISDDILKSQEALIQKVTDEHIAELEAALQKKEKD